MPAMGPHHSPMGLRERRKLRTRQDLLRFGLELFADQGYGRTTVGDIARRAEVSERTFFRYFASKEELVLQPIREASDLFLTEVALRPHDEEPLRALREARRHALYGMAERRPQTYLQALRLTCLESEVQAAFLRFCAGEQRRLAEVLAARARTGPGDLRPALLAGAFSAATRLATLSWGEFGGGSVQELQAAADSHLGLMHAALEGHWR